jgi:hypothetical protein
MDSYPVGPDQIILADPDSVRDRHPGPADLDPVSGGEGG